MPAVKDTGAAERAYIGLREDGHCWSPCDQEHQDQHGRNRMGKGVKRYLDGRRDHHKHGRA